ncbi:MAG: hypothetical protein M3071_06260 [Actinomycetota bacterium]|nr:hypothetical protein [Actinomycetota bacterium]
MSELAATPIGPEPCFLTSLTIRGHQEPSLLEGGILLNRAGAILGLRLTSS